MSSPERERSVKQMIGRIVGTIGTWGRDGGYFATEDEAQTFEDELKAILVNQLAAFNSPVWFNVGFEEKPQCSACFILSIDDSMDSILDWIRREGVIFRGGSGSGVNLSRLRSSKEQLSKGGYASGPVSFMRGADASAGTIKSGGKTRRAAKMVVLDVDHPDIIEFIWCKAHEEEKARVLEAAGYDMSLDSPDWASIQYQNANNSVRVSDAFMEAVETDADWNLTARTDGTVVETIKARKLLHDIAEAAWRCADPGVQYDTTINALAHAAEHGPHQRVEPVLRVHVDRRLGVQPRVAEPDEVPPRGRRARRRGVRARLRRRLPRAGDPRRQLVVPDAGDRAEREGVPPARARLREPRRAADGARPRVRLRRGPRLRRRDHRADDRAAPTASRRRSPAGWARSPATARTPRAMIGVIAKHRAAVGNIADAETVPADLLGAARKAWDDALDLGEVNGYRNAQATVLAPTGTISFMMDCDTTGVEPDFSLVKSKKLVGGGEITIVNKTVPLGLEKLGYAPNEVDEIVAFIDERNTVVGAPYVKSEHYPVFDCAVGERAIHYRGHVKMMGAIQPFISGAISKTVNLPETATIDDVAQLYVEAWKLGVKAVAIYRDNCKVAQPLSGKSDKGAQQPLAPAGLRRARRRGAALPDDRTEIGRKFRVGEYEGYIHVGVFDDGTPGDIFVDIAKDGTTLQGLMNSLMIAVSMGLQYGVPPEVYVSKLSHLRFEPSGPTNDADIRAAKSIPDYIFRWFGKKFLDVDQQEEAGILSAEVRAKLADQYANGGSTPRRRGAGARARRRSSTRTRTRSSATAAAAAWCAQARATRAATAARRTGCG